MRSPDSITIPSQKSPLVRRGRRERRLQCYSIALRYHLSCLQLVSDYFTVIQPQTFSGMDQFRAKIHRAIDFDFRDVAIDDMTATLLLMDDYLWNLVKRYNDPNHPDAPDSDNDWRNDLKEGMDIIYGAHREAIVHRMKQICRVTLTNVGMQLRTCLICFFLGVARGVFDRAIVELCLPYTNHPDRTRE